ncbi:hypothetical protein NEIRO03_0913 [Nematocida sp. AWRm78]|nr:hypothetical protein NEIRO02_0981 [Nematocida sp. AWRm79]KAI5183300.1 hypothetical protein NEIRO03_0913 [Nematocida sp. AWRm78]
MKIQIIILALLITKTVLAEQKGIFGGIWIGKSGKNKHGHQQDHHHHHHDKHNKYGHPGKYDKYGNSNKYGGPSDKYGKNPYKNGQHYSKPGKSGEPKYHGGGYSHMPGSEDGYAKNKSVSPPHGYSQSQAQASASASAESGFSSHGGPGLSESAVGSGSAISGSSHSSAHASAHASSSSSYSLNIKDGLAAANVIGNYYNTLVERKGAISGISPITGIMAYPIGNGLYTDYWGKIKFQMNEGGTLVDSSGYFSGVPVGTKEEIISTGDLSDIGFYQQKGLPEEVANQNYISTKMLIEEIANTTKKDVQQLHDEKIDFQFLDGIMGYYKNQKKQLESGKKSCMTVCICSNSTCTGQCKSIKCVEPMYLL